MDPQKLQAYPSLATVEQLIIREKQGNCIPVFVQLPADLITPCMAYLRIAQGSKYSFLLESVIAGENIARYSFVGADPLKVIKTGPNEEITGDPMVALQRELSVHQFVKIPEIPTFTGGAIGYVSYDCVRYFEPKTARDLNDPLGIPESLFMITDSILIYDHLFQNIKVVSHVFYPKNAGTTNLSFVYQTQLPKSAGWLKS